MDDVTHWLLEQYKTQNCKRWLVLYVLGHSEYRVCAMTFHVLLLKICSTSCTKWI